MGALQSKHVCNLGIMLNCHADNGQLHGCMKSLREARAFLAAWEAHGAKSKNFSSVSFGEASNLLWALQVPEVVGNELDENVPPNTAPDCDAYDDSRCSAENVWMSGLMQHHQSQLEKFGARFGRDGVKAYDLHAEEELFSTTVSGQDCHGGIDGAISAFGLAKSSARRCMVAYELKRSDTQCPADSEQFANPLQVCCLLTNVSLLLYMDQSCNSMQTALWTHLVFFSLP